MSFGKFNHFLRGCEVAKVRRCKLSWKPSESDQVIGYRLYWSKGNSVSYDSNFFELGNVSEVYLPDVLKLNPRYESRIVLGLTAMDMNGNESDMVTVATAYQTIAPAAPAGLMLTPLDEFSIVACAGIEQEEAHLAERHGQVS